MLVYRSTLRLLDVREVLSDLETRLTPIATPSSSILDTLRSVLIDAGELEAGVVDSECPEVDDITPSASVLDRTIRAIARLFTRGWRGIAIGSSELDDALRELRASRRMLAANSVATSVPEGFAFYGLFPEAYLAAADALIRDRSIMSMVVIGVRSIGTTLSAVVAAALEEQGLSVQRLTVRPRGHPFDRELRLSDRLRNHLRTLAERSSTLFAIVDEGPGLSGSSFASVVEQLQSLGVADDRLVLFPSWYADASNLASDRARRVWPRLAKFIGDFDRLWLASGRLEHAFDARIVSDLSAGAWRSLFFPIAEVMPPVQPQHERRKFLARRSDGEQMLIKFEGLDHRAAQRRSRAERVAGAGFGTPVDRLAHGFLATRWAEGSPVHPSEVGPELLRRIARYLAWTSRCERSGRVADPAPLMEMLRVNAEEGLGPEWATLLVRRASAAAEAVGRAPAVRVDGRMFPHEWLQTPSGYLKTDVASHFDDHFYPGETDVAWDVAAIMVEFDLDRAAASTLLRDYQGASGDPDIEYRLRFMRPAYAAFRLGYATLASAALGSGDDAGRMRAAARRYTDALRGELSVDQPDGQSCATGT